MEPVKICGWKDLKTLARLSEALGWMGGQLRLRLLPNMAKNVFSVIDFKVKTRKYSILRNDLEPMIYVEKMLKCCTVQPKLSMETYVGL